MKIVTSQQMKQAEALADASGLPYARMMENAGSAAAQQITHIAVVQSRSVLVLVGPGNNGGDGLVVARYLHDAHATVSVHLFRARPDDDANLKLVHERNISVICADDDPGFAKLSQQAAKADIIVDALLGTGADRPIDGTMKSMLDTVRDAIAQRQAPPLMVAIDLPSGLNADTGSVDPAALPADLTVTFAFPKRGLYLFPGAAFAGEVVVADIGIPAQAVASVPLEVSEPQSVVQMLPKRPVDAHKGTFGKLLVVAGCANYTGAAYLASTAAYRVGAGLVTLAVGRSLQPILAAKTSEVTFLPLPEAEPGYLSADGAPVLLNALVGYDVLLIGCGLGAHPATRDLVLSLVSQLKQVPNLCTIIDADGLNALASHPGWASTLPPQTILTPHPGEMSRLSGLSMQQVGEDRIGIAMARASIWQAVVVLKGAYTVIASPSGQATINPFANPALATAGTGDVLAGAIAGLATQGASPYAAAVAGAYLHASAATVVVQQMGDTGMVASDLLPVLPFAMRALRHPAPQDE